MSGRLTASLLALGVGMFAFFWLARINPAALPVNDDAIRDQLLVRDCTDLGSCHLLGAPSSFGHFYHGTVWLDLLAAVRLLGGEIAQQREVVLVLLALAVATFFIVVWRWLHATLALPAALILLGGLSIDTPATLLINPSVAPYPDVLTSGSLLCFALSLRRRFLVMSAFSLGVAMNVHTASLTLLIPQLLIVAMVRAHGWRDVLITLLIAGLAYAVPSSAALRANIIALAELGPILPMLVVGMLFVLIAMACGPRFRRLRWRARAWLTGALMCAPFSVFILWLTVVQGHHFTSIYLHPILAPGAVMAAAVIAVPFQFLARWRMSLAWIPTAIAGLLMVVAAMDGWARAPSSPQAQASWSLSETAAVAAWAEQGGWRYDDLLLRVQGTGCRELMVGMSTVLATAPTPTPRRQEFPIQMDDGLQLQVIRAASESDAATGHFISVGSSRVLVQEIRSWMRPRRLRSCRAPVAGTPPICGPANERVLDAYQPQRFLFLRRSIPAVTLDQHPTRPYVATYAVPLVPVRGASREIQIASGDVALGWRITRVEGVRAVGPLPSTRLHIDAENADQGVIVFEKTFGAGDRGDIDHYYPPCLLETRVGDPLQERVASL